MTSSALGPAVGFEEEQPASATATTSRPNTLMSPFKLTAPALTLTLVTRQTGFDSPASFHCRILRKKS